MAWHGIQEFLHIGIVSHVNGDVASPPVMLGSTQCVRTVTSRLVMVV